MKKIGFFGGSFDPIHLGHLNLALRIMEEKKLDQVLFCPAHISPTKGDKPPIASPKDRLNMLQLALEDVPNCDPFDGEILRPPPSYTIDTVRKLPDRCFLIVAEDAAYGFDQWKEIDTLLSLAPPLVGVRHRFNSEKLGRLPVNIQVKIREGMCQIPAMDISSTEVRE